MSLKCVISTWDCTFSNFSLWHNPRTDCTEISDFIRGIKAELSLDLHNNRDYWYKDWVIKQLLNFEWKWWYMDTKWIRARKQIEAETCLPTEHMAADGDIG